MKWWSQRQFIRISAIALLCVFVLASFGAPLCAVASACAMPCCDHAPSTLVVAITTPAPCCTIHRAAPSQAAEIVVLPSASESNVAVIEPTKAFAAPLLQPPAIGVATTTLSLVGERRIHLVNSIFLI